MFGTVLGIDPGVSRCGYGAVAEQGGVLSALTCGVIRTPTSMPLPERLAALEAELEALMVEVGPVAVAVERVFFQVNVRTAMSVGQASGLALAVAARAGVAVCQYTPNEVKQAVAGYGAAPKAQVQDMVARLLRLPEVPRPPDAADALALAICHLSAGRFRTRSEVEAAAAGGPVPALARAIAAATTQREDR
jgi:crossover junction endodeoxyribonuclease RuvC